MQVLHQSRVKPGVLAREPRGRALLERLKRQQAFYATPFGSNDDWYWLHAAVLGGGGLPAPSLHAKLFAAASSACQLRSRWLQPWAILRLGAPACALAQAMATHWFLVSRFSSKRGLSGGLFRDSGHCCSDPLLSRRRAASLPTDHVHANLAWCFRGATLRKTSMQR